MAVMFVGYIVCSEGVEVEPRKTEVVKKWPRPLKQTYNKRFLGLTGYYKSFVDGLASITFPLTTITQKSVKFVWSETCKRSFQILKESITSSPVLTLPEGIKGFVLYCDASQMGLGCVLIQH